MKKLYTFLMTLLSFSAVMAQSNKYVKVSVEPEDWTGTYLIVFEADDDNNVAYVFNGALEAKNLDSKANFFEAANPAENIEGQDVRVITGNEQIDAATFSIAKSETEGTYNIKSASGYWIGYDNAEKGEPNLEYNNETPFDNTIAMEEGKTSINIVGKVGNYQLRFNADEGKERFRYHELGKKKSVKLYRKSEATTISAVEAESAAKQVYNLQGQPVSGVQKGVSIVDGKVIINQ